MAGQQPPSPNAANGGGYSANYANNGGAGAVNGSIMPSAGHFADMQTLMQNMETLSGWLQQNREEWMGLRDGLERVERIQGRDGGMLRGEERLTNGDGGPVEPEEELPTRTSLSANLATAQNRIHTLETQAREHETLQSLYESTLSDATDRIRQYIYAQQQHVIELHRHYTEMLQQSREETMDARVVHGKWQESLQRLSSDVRDAYQAREEERRPYLGKIRGLREENRVLRKMVGWEAQAPDSDDEEDEAVAERERQVVDRGRMSRAEQGEGLAQRMMASMESERGQAG